jgi:hypothetical protein
MRLRHDMERDVLRFELRAGSGRSVRVAATIDVGEGGRLLGVETPDLTEPGAADPFFLPLSRASGLSRSAEAMATVTLDDAGRVLAIETPRRGPGYEISWPSGNR